MIIDTNGSSKYTKLANDPHQHNFVSNGRQNVTFLGKKNSFSSTKDFS